MHTLLIILPSLTVQLWSICNAHQCVAWSLAQSNAVGTLNFFIESLVLYKVQHVYGLQCRGACGSAKAG